MSLTCSKCGRPVVVEGECERCVFARYVVLACFAGLLLCVLVAWLIR